MTVDTNFELLDAIINNPIEAVLLLGISIYIYKFFLGNGHFARDTRRAFFRWMRNIPSDIGDFIAKCIFNPHSFTNVKIEKLDETLELIKNIHTLDWWSADHFLKAKLQISQGELTKIMQTLRNLQLVVLVKDTDYEKNYKQYYRVATQENKGADIV